MAQADSFPSTERLRAVADVPRLLDGAGIAHLVHWVADDITGVHSLKGSASGVSVAQKRAGAAFQAVRELVQGAVACGAPATKVRAALTDAGVDSAAADEAASAFEVRLPDLRRAAVERALALGSVELVDFDWSARLTMGSDTLASMREPVLVVSLRLRDPDGAEHTTVCEMTREQLEGMVTAVAAAQQAALALQVN